MNVREPSLDDVAAAVLDGTPVDWAVLGEAARKTDADLLQELRLLWDIGAVTRDREAVRTPVGDHQLGFWGRYVRLARIGGGSSGTVYRAWDPTLDRQVALKIIQTGAADRHSTTILREARLLARIRHPGVVTIYEAERIGGEVGLSMELVEGPTLEERLRRDGALTAADTAAIGLQLCEALEAVHSAGVLHRDIKASNIATRHDGRIALMDFGAGLPRAAAFAAAAGTPLYVAPEVLDGAPATVASDIYSLGVLLHRLHTGRYLVPARTLAELRQTHERRRLTRSGLTDERMRPPLDTVIARATEPDPGQRYDSAATMGADLRRAVVPTSYRRGTAALIAGLLLAAVAAGLTAAAAAGGGAGPAAAAASPGPASIAVLPFAVDEDGDEHVVLRDGVARDLIATLQASSQVRVVSAASALTLGAGRINARQITERLGADYALAGRLRRAGDRVEVRARLIRLADQRAVWSERYEMPLLGVPGLPAAIAVDVSRSLGVRGGTIQDWPTRSLDAYRLYVRGQTALDQFTREGTRAALRYFEQALIHDADYAQAHASIALAYLTGPALMEVPAAQALDLASTAAHRALALDPTLPEAHIASAAVKSARADWPGAERDYRQAIELGPGNVVVRQAFARWLSLLGRFDEALEHARVAEELDPLSPRALMAVSSVLRFARRYDEAIAQNQKVLALDPAHQAAHLNLGHCYQGLGRRTEAITAFERAGSRGNLGNAYALAGREAEARAIIASLERTYARPELAAGEIAQVYVGLGEIDQAFAWLDRVHHLWPTTFKVAAVWDPLRADPRFALVLKKHGLTD